VATSRINGDVGDWTPRGQSLPSWPPRFPRERPLKRRRPTLPLTRCPHPRKPSFRETSARPIRALGQGASTGLPAILLSSRIGRRRLRHRCEPIFAPGPQNAIRTVIEAAGEDALTKVGSVPDSTSLSYFLPQLKLTKRRDRFVPLHMLNYKGV
jgi:hypothetical protein